jgi:hypothetical protein
MVSKCSSLHFLPEADPSKKFQEPVKFSPTPDEPKQIGCGDNRRPLRQDLRSAVPCQLVENEDNYPLRMRTEPEENLLMIKKP